MARESRKRDAGAGFGLSMLQKVLAIALLVVAWGGPMLPAGVNSVEPLAIRAEDRRGVPIKSNRT